MRILLTVAFAMSAATAFAQGAAKPVLGGTFNKWTTWSYTGSYSGKGTGKVCYIYSEPDKKSPAGLDHGRVSFSNTTSPSEGVKTEANFVTGYPMKEQSSATIQIGSKAFTMFTQGDSAWLVNKDDEAALLDAMRGGSTMIIKATSRRGNDTSYEYSLAGVTAASDKMRADCK
jgi:invasion protein IalB